MAQDIIRKPNKNKLQLKIQGILIGCLALCFIFLQFIQYESFEVFISIIILLVIIWVLPGIRGTTLYISLFLLITGLYLMLSNQTPIDIWFESLRINLPLVSIFIVVPILGIPVKIGGYISALKTLLSHKLNKPSLFYIGMTLLTHFLSVVINIGSISIVSELTKASNIRDSRIIANVINRGYITSVFWSPYFSSMALILAFLPIKWSSIVGYAFGFVIISMTVSFILDWKRIKNPLTTNESNLVNTEKVNHNDLDLIQAKQKAIELLLYIILITTVVLSLEFITKSSMVLIVCLTSLIFPVIWLFILGNGKMFFNELKGHIFEGIPRMKKEIILFLIAGFFSGAFIYADLGEMFMTFLSNTFGEMQIGIAYFIAITIFLAALIGIHPIVIITVLVTSVVPESIGLGSEYFALLLLMSFGVSNTVSPSTAVNNLLVNLLNVRLIDVSLKWNLKYSLIMLFILPIYLKIMNV